MKGQHAFYLSYVEISFSMEHPLFTSEALRELSVASPHYRAVKMSGGAVETSGTQPQGHGAARLRRAAALGGGNQRRGGALAGARGGGGQHDAHAPRRAAADAAQRRKPPRQHGVARRLGDAPQVRPHQGRPRRRQHLPLHAAHVLLCEPDQQRRRHPKLRRDGQGHPRLQRGDQRARCGGRPPGRRRRRRRRRCGPHGRAVAVHAAQRVWCPGGAPRASSRSARACVWV